MKKFLAILAVIFVLPLASCAPETKTITDVTVWDLNYLDLTGRYTAEAVVLEDGESEAYDVSFSIAHAAGPSTKWYGVTSTAEIEKIVFGITEQVCYDGTTCNYSVESTFVGEATAKLASITTTFVYYLRDQPPQTVVKQWTFRNIKQITNEANFVMQDRRLTTIPVLDTLPIDFQEAIAIRNTTR